MSKKHNIYWNCQFIGWSLYAAINLIFFKLSYNTNLKDILLFLIWLPLGITITHAYRYLILKFNVLRFSLLIQIPLILVASLVMSILFFIINIIIKWIMLNVSITTKFVRCSVQWRSAVKRPFALRAQSSTPHHIYNLSTQSRILMCKLHKSQNK